MYIIIKYVKNEKGIEIPVIMVDSHSEIWEFNSIEEADKISNIMNINSDSGHKYMVKKIGS
jgi:hypothetical protein